MIPLSPKNSLNVEDIYRISRNALIMFSPVLILILTQVQNNEYDSVIIIGMVCSILIDTLRRYIREVK